MFEIIKKSFKITLNNPILIMAFMIFIIVVTLFSPKLASMGANWLALLALFAILMLYSGFYAGWFEMVKYAIENSKKEYENAEEEFLDTSNLRHHFFDAIPSYILPVMVCGILYITLFSLLLSACFVIANKYIGSIDFVIAHLKTISQSQAALIEYVSGLSSEKLAIIYGWNTLFGTAICLFGVFTIFWPSALYYETKNPIKAFWKSFVAIFKKPLGVIGLNIFIGVLIAAFVALGGLFALNEITYFIYSIVSIYLFTFLIVLIFNYYEKFLFNRNCGGNRIRENETGN